jgi:integrase
MNLQIKASDSKRTQTRIDGGKGKKDRYTNLSKKVLELLHVYFEKYRPHYCLFQGQGSTKEKPFGYSGHSIQAILGKAIIKAGIQKHLRVHTLRQSSLFRSNKPKVAIGMQLVSYKAEPTCGIFKIYSAMKAKDYNTDDFRDKPI